MVFSLSNALPQPNGTLRRSPKDWHLSKKALKEPRHPAIARIRGHAADRGIPRREAVPDRCVSRHKKMGLSVWEASPRKGDILPPVSKPVATCSSPWISSGPRIFVHAVQDRWTRRGLRAGSRSNHSTRSISMCHFVHLSQHGGQIIRPIR